MPSACRNCASQRCILTEFWEGGRERELMWMVFCVIRSTSELRLYIQSQRAFDWHFLWYALTGRWTKCVGNVSSAVLFWLSHIYVILFLSLSFPLYLSAHLFLFILFLPLLMPTRIQYLIIIYCVWRSHLTNQPPTHPQSQRFSKITETEQAENMM